MATSNPPRSRRRRIVIVILHLIRTLARRVMLPRTEIGLRDAAGLMISTLDQLVARHYTPLTICGELMPEPLTLLQGTVDLLILKALSSGPNHGYGVSIFIRQRTEGTLTLEDAALYPSLHRLERQRLVGAEWGLSENNRKAKFYRLTAKGRRQLQRETTTWERYADAVFKVLHPVEER